MTGPTADTAAGSGRLSSALLVAGGPASKQEEEEEWESATGARQNSNLDT